ncbi:MULTISPECIES: hypothetical protein [Phyllobacteriaceae]|jgi:hypothetical protein|uniref:Uncharacterized protein n=1 Tax=Mesorhizobium hungaricum TaxID=1566387 RepID=A0A1C2DHP4_9HYPH|nr:MULTISPECIES: hypothetical protein [Mesorhizobium]MBN9235338.1 hypothetical protein [Mesorhizobium sp.]MDQ0332741.1 hypothetical protein [Mesorhizobium sp. YL-MeA3-2017]OCX14282.1 hypothetical protein QV13_17440 [Mesorhizobium hungaricum]
MAAELDTVLFDMAVRTASALPSGFSEKVVDVARRTAGQIVFDVRVEGDYRFQRLAGIRYPTGEVGILALTKNGQSLETCRVNGTLASFIEPLETWSYLPLQTQASVDILGHTSLLVAALRNAGSFSR